MIVTDFRKTRKKKEKEDDIFRKENDAIRLNLVFLYFSYLYARKHVILIKLRIEEKEKNITKK